MRKILSRDDTPKCDENAWDDDDVGNADDDSDVQ